MSTTKKDLERKVAQLEKWLYESLRNLESYLFDEDETLDDYYDKEIIAWYKEKRKNDKNYKEQLKEEALSKIREYLSDEEMEILGLLNEQ